MVTAAGFGTAGLRKDPTHSFLRSLSAAIGPDSSGGPRLTASNCCPRWSLSHWPSTSFAAAHHDDSEVLQFPAPLLLDGSISPAWNKRGKEPAAASHLESTKLESPSGNLERSSSLGSSELKADPFSVRDLIGLTQFGVLGAHLDSPNGWTVLADS